MTKQSGHFAMNLKVSQCNCAASNKIDLQ